MRRRRPSMRAAPSPGWSTSRSRRCQGSGSCCTPPDRVVHAAFVGERPVAAVTRGAGTRRDPVRTTDDRLDPLHVGAALSGDEPERVQARGVGVCVRLGPAAGHLLRGAGRGRRARHGDEHEGRQNERKKIRSSLGMCDQTSGRSSWKRGLDGKPFIPTESAIFLKRPPGARLGFKLDARDVPKSA